MAVGGLKYGIQLGLKYNKLIKIHFFGLINYFVIVNFLIVIYNIICIEQLRDFKIHLQIIIYFKKLTN